MLDDAPQNPLYSSTYTLYRVSPLYTGDASLLDAATLGTHARRLRDVLSGDALRGMYDGELGSNSMKDGELQSCEWRILERECVWTQRGGQQGRSNNARDDDGDGIGGHGGAASAEEARGIHIELRYPRATHTAVLLRASPQRSGTQETEHPGFTSLPLLLLRLPAAIRSKVIEYLETSFDCRIAPLRLRSEFLTSGLEGALERAGRKTAPGREEESQGEEATDVGNVQIQLCFAPAAPSLKNLDITIAAEDVPGFWQRGREILAAEERRARSQNPVRDTQQVKESKDARNRIAGPFTAALSRYLKEHTTLYLEHAGVAVSKVACKAFALDSQGKVKIFAPLESRTATAEETASQPWTLEFIDRLVQEAEGGRLLSVTEKAREKRPLEVTGQATARAEKRRKVRRGETEEVDELTEMSGVPSEPPPPYEEVDPARGR